MAKSKSPSTPFIPKSIKAFFARRVFDGAALSLIIAGLYIGVSLLTYNAQDTSLNTAGNAVQSLYNKAGEAGALLSDVLIQSLGITTFIIAIALCVWGYKLFRRAPSALPLSVRISFLVSSLFLLAMAATPLQNTSDASALYYGGALGHSIVNGLYGLVSAASLTGLRVGVVTVSALAGILCFGLSLGLSLSFWKSFSKYSFAGIRSGITRTALFIRQCYYWLKNYDEWEVARAEKQRKTAKPAIQTPKAQEEHIIAAPDVPLKNAKIITPEKNIVMPRSTNQSGNKQKRISFADLGDWELPSIDMLQEPRAEDLELRLDEKALQRNADMLQQVLTDFGVEGDIVKIRPGPVVTLYELEPAPGVKSSKVIGLSDDIARSMSALSVRAAVVPGRSVIGIEIPNQKRQIVFLRSLIESSDYAKTKAALPLILGKDIGGDAVVADLAKMPHLLIAGTTGSGKSVAVNTMILSLLYTLSPEQCRMIMIDPKMLELSVYDDIPHLLSPVVTDPGRAVVALKWAVQEMENRYRAMSKFGVRNVDGYNKRIKDLIAKEETITRKIQTGYDPETGKPVFEDEQMDLQELPYIVIIVDEFADLMLVAGKDVESAIQRLAQMARAAGIHLIMATQRPSVDVITGVIKANFPTRISFQVTSKFDSRTILGEGGAEQLLGRGDMLYMASGGKIQRVHGPFVDDKEVEDVVNFVKEQGEPDYLSAVTDEDGSGIPGLFDSEGGGGSDVDEMYDEAVALVAREQKASTSFIQRHLQIGYNRAARIIEEMEKQGVVGPANHVGKREILVSDHSGRDAGAA